jgi:hypothetical protein
MKRRRRPFAAFACCALLFAVWIAIGSGLDEPRAVAAEPCDAAAKADMQQKMSGYRADIEINESQLDKLRNADAAHFLEHGRTNPTFDGLISRTTEELAVLRKALEKSRFTYQRCFGPVPSTFGDAPVITPARPGRAQPSAARPPSAAPRSVAAEPQSPPPAPPSSAVAVHFLSFTDAAGGGVLVQAPADYAWARMLGKRGTPVTRSLTLTCPARKNLGSPITFLCTFVSADHEPGTYNVQWAKITRSGNAEATLANIGKNGLLRLFLGTATVYDTSTKPARTYTEPPRVITLTQTEP